jgi:hypothetical protein
MLTRIGLLSSRALFNASSPHGYQSTGLWACCSRYGLVSRARRFGITCVVELRMSEANANFTLGRIARTFFLWPVGSRLWTAASRLWGAASRLWTARTGQHYFFFSVTARYFSRADTIEGAWGRGALISRVRPASSTAREVLLPKAPIFVPFCLNFG